MISNIIYFFHGLLVAILQLLPDIAWANRIRGFFFGILMKKTGKNLQVSKSVNILAIRNLSVGDNVFIGYGVWINAYGGLDIGSEVMIGPYCTISTANHTKDPNGSYRWGQHSLCKVTLEKGCWLGASVNVLPGATVGSNVVVGAGSVIKNHLIENSVYCGLLATKKR